MADQTSIPPELLELLACPACDDRPKLVLADSEDGMCCAVCGRVYPITPSGIPKLVVDAAPSDNTREE